MNHTKEWIETLPCGLVINITQGQCCKKVCPEGRKTYDEIENCEHWKKGRESRA